MADEPIIPLDLGDVIPSFYLDSQVGEIDFEDSTDGKWCLLITVGSSFDPVTTTEIGMLSRLELEFESRNIAVLVVGNDSVGNYRKWVKDIEDIQAVRVNLPILADKDCKILHQLGCAKYSPLDKKILPTCNGSFLLDLDRRIRVSNKYGFMTGRNWYEFFRVYDALQLSTYKKVLTPANWGQGQDVLLSEDITKDEATEFRFTEIKPWFKLTPCPEL